MEEGNRKGILVDCKLVWEPLHGWIMEETYLREMTLDSTPSKERTQRTIEALKESMREKGIDPNTVNKQWKEVTELMSNLK